MILEIDVGNSRIKWRLCHGLRVVARGAGNSDDLSALLDAVAVHPELNGNTPSRIRVASVRGEAFERALAAEASLRWRVITEFARSGSVCGPVANGYVQPATLGVDRWLGILAAYDLARRACCVVDAGSAITVDIVSSGGQHKGGYIVPGLQLQRDSFVSKTGLQLDGPPAWQEVAPGLRTQDALDNGILAMVLGATIAMTEAAAGESDRALYLTGGDAAVLSAQLHRHNVPHMVVPDLVLDGLALALP